MKREIVQLKLERKNVELKREKGKGRDNACKGKI